MAKAKLTPMSVLNQMFSLTPEQIHAIMKSGGANYVVTKVTCLGQQQNGQFVYACEGEKLPKYISTFKVKIVPGVEFNPDPLRILDGQFVLCWA